MSFLLQGALLNRVLGLTINLTVVRSFWIESHAEEQKCGEFPDIYHFVACFFAGGVPCPQWILEAENNAVCSLTEHLKEMLICNPKKHVQQSRAHWSFFGCSFGTVYKSTKTVTGDYPQNKSCPNSIEPATLTSHSLQTRESSISPRCHGPIFCTWPTLPMRPEPICIARERHGLFILKGLC